MKRLTHLNTNGRVAQVDVGHKPVTCREALAYGEIRIQPKTIRLILKNGLAKGDVFATAKIAGILACKRVHEIIPLCHTIILDSVNIDFEVKPDRICVTARARAQGRTGVEMEALMAASVSCLTVYDMAKSADKEMAIGPLYVLEKKGGRSGHYVRQKKI